MAKVWLVIERDYDGIQSFRAFSDPVKAEAFVAESIPEVKLEIEEMDIDADVGRAFRRCWVGWLRLIDREATGFHARVVQHECDHLIGRLYPTRMRDLTQLGFTSVLFPELDPNADD